ncbi:MAG: MFS transporter [Cyanobacteria bacterium P01_F01_bin.150]
MINQSATRNRVLWPRVCGLAAVQGAIALTWVIYNLYLKKLLTQYGFSPEFATALLILENLLATIMEPLMGSFSDRFQHWMGSRFPFIAVGIILASTCFIAIPTVLAFGGPSGIARWLLPIAMVLWAFTMTLFRSPALSLLGRYAFASNLPQAASILTLVGGLAGAMGPIAGDFILRMGPLFTFGLGSVILLGAGAVLRAVGPDQGISTSNNAPVIANTPLIQSIKKLALVFGTGVGSTLGFRLMMKTLPSSLPADLPETSLINGKIVIGAIFITLAVTALPSGILATRLGTKRGIISGLGAMAICCGGLAIAQGQGVFLVLLAIALGTCFSLVSNTTIPFALSMVSPQKAGLGTGMFFSGGAAASSLFGSVAPTLANLPNSVGALLGAGGYAIAAFCVMLSRKYD